MELIVNVIPKLNKKAWEDAFKKMPTPKSQVETVVKEQSPIKSKTETKSKTKRDFSGDKQTSKDDKPYKYTPSAGVPALEFPKIGDDNYKGKLEMIMNEGTESQQLRAIKLLADLQKKEFDSELKAQKEQSKYYQTMLKEVRAKKQLQNMGLIPNDEEILDEPLVTETSPEDKPIKKPATNKNAGIGIMDSLFGMIGMGGIFDGMGDSGGGGGGESGGKSSSAETTKKGVMSGLKGAGIVAIGTLLAGLISKLVNFLIQASPRLQATIKRMIQPIVLVLRNYGDMIASFLKPIMQRMRAATRYARQNATGERGSAEYAMSYNLNFSKGMLTGGKSFSASIMSLLGLDDDLTLGQWIVNTVKGWFGLDDDFSFSGWIVKKVKSFFKLDDNVTVAQWLSELITEVKNKVWTALGLNDDVTITDWLTTIINAIKTKVFEFITGQELPDGASFWVTIWNEITTRITNFVNSIVESSPTLTWIKSKIWDPIKGAFNDFVDGINDTKAKGDGSFWVGAWRTVRDAFTGWIDGVEDGDPETKGFWANAWGIVKTGFSNFIYSIFNMDSGESFWSQMFTKIKEKIENFIYGLPIVGDFLGFLKSDNKLGDIANSLGNIGSSIVNGIGGILPVFAEGGYVNKPTVALIGEGGEGEYIIPESKLNSFVTNYVNDNNNLLSYSPKKTMSNGSSGAQTFQFINQGTIIAMDQVDKMINEAMRKQAQQSRRR